jgi:hypothetical protein
MSDRITVKDVRALLDSVKRAAISAGIDEASRWHLEVGSKTYGNAWRIWLAHEDYERAVRSPVGALPEDLDPGWSAHYSPIVRDYLGMTAREAFDTLNTLRNAFHAVTWARES